MAELPVDSRTAKDARNDALDLSDHLTATTIDLLRLIDFKASLNAVGSIGGKEFAKAMKGAPKPMERPTIRPEDKPKEKKRFVSGRELKEMMGQVHTQTVIAHTTLCVESKINLGGQQLNCSCPPMIK